MQDLPVPLKMCFILGIFDSLLLFGYLKLYRFVSENKEYHNRTQE